MLTHQERMELAIKFNQERRAGVFAGRIATRDKLILDELSPEEIAQLVSIYPSWDSFIGKPLKDGTVPGETQDIVSHQGTLYKVTQGHTAQADWSPDVAVSLFTSFTPVGTIAEWKQPTGGHDAYQIGDKVMYKTKVWTSKINANTTVPDGDEPYNRYWEPQA